MWPIFGSYDHLMINYPFCVFYDQWPFCLTVMAILNLKQKYIIGDNMQLKYLFSLRKHAYSNTLKILPPKNENFQIKNSDTFLYFCSKHKLWVQNIYCGYSLEPPQQGGSNEYPQSMYLSRNKKNNVYPFKPQFNYIKAGFKGVKII